MLFRSFIKTGKSEFKATQKCLEWILVIRKTMNEIDSSDHHDKISNGLLKAAKIMGEIAETTSKISEQIEKFDDGKQHHESIKNNNSSFRSRENSSKTSHEKSIKNKPKFPDLAKFPKKNRKNWYEI